MKRAALIVLVVWHGVSAVGAELAQVRLPPGKTLLTELVRYRVGFRQGKQSEKYMPDSWTGRFNTPSKIAFVPNQHIMGREAILMHPPWQGGTGPVWVDYPVQLTEVNSVKLNFWMGMSEEELAPGKSDGVTFQCAVIEDDESHLVFSEYYQQRGWKKVALDLSAWAGKTVTIRLLNHPGPKNNCNFDTAYIGEPQLVCGQVTEAGLGERIAALTRTRTYRETVKAGLKRMVNNPTDSILPGNAVSYSNRIQKTDTGYAMRYAGKDGKVTWHYTPATGTLDDFVVQFADATPFSPAKTGGVYLEVDNGETRLEGGSAVALTAQGAGLQVVWAYPGKAQTIEVTFRAAEGYLTGRGRPSRAETRS
jgi:hypothetical protein